MWSDTFVDQVAFLIHETPLTRILFTEGEDHRVRRAAQFIAEKQLALPLVYAKEKIPGIDTLWDPAWEVGNDRLVNAAHLLLEGKVSGVISGAVFDTAEVIRIGLKHIGLQPTRKRLSGMFVMDTGRQQVGHEGVLIFADPIVIPQPTTEDYLEIIQGAYEMWHLLFPGVNAKAALLDFSSVSGQFAKFHPNETEQLQTFCPDLLLDGPLQVDAALIPEVAVAKTPSSPLLGRANILIFPDLKSGNIGYKLVERLGGARAVPLLSGFKRPWNDLSRGSKWEDIVLTAAISIFKAHNAESNRATG